MTVGGSTVLGFDFSGAVIPAGCGTLTILDLDGEASGLTGITISDTNAQAIVFSYHEGSGDGGSSETACDCDGNIDSDDDGICDGADDCIGEYDECGVCNGDGIADGACAVSYTHLTLPTILLV